MEKQVICFIDPVKFYYLLGEKKAKSIGHSKIDFNRLGYISQDGKYESSDFNLEKAKSAAILIVPDSFDLYHSYTPEIPFKVLYHSKTDKELRVNPLIGLSDKCQGFEQSSESKSTVYNDVALIIGFEKKEIAKKFDEIYGRIKMIDPKIRVVTDYLYNCLNNQIISEAIQDLEDVGVDVSFLKGKTSKNFTDIRDNLLSQCNFNMQNS